MSGVLIAKVNPFWRYAVALDERPDLPGVPFFSRARAECFAAQCRMDFPHRTTTIYQRRAFGRVDVADGEDR